MRAKPASPTSFAAGRLRLSVACLLRLRDLSLRLPYLVSVPTESCLTSNCCCFCDSPPLHRRAISAASLSALLDSSSSLSIPIPLTDQLTIPSLSSLPLPLSYTTFSPHQDPSPAASPRLCRLARWHNRRDARHKHYSHSCMTRVYHPAPEHQPIIA